MNCKGFGIFRLSFSVKEGHENKKDVTAKDIETLRVLFRPSSELKKQLFVAAFLIFVKYAL